MLAGLSSGAGVEEVDCENLNDIMSAVAHFDMMTAALDALEMVS